MRLFCTLQVIILTVLLGTFLNSPVIAEEHAAATLLYQQHCAQCHGADLSGGSASSLIDGQWMYGAEPGYMIRNTKHGLPHLGMPAYEEALSDSEIRSIIQYILSQEHSIGATRPPVPDELQTIDYLLKVEEWVDGLEIPWAIDFMDSRTALITERPGPVRLVVDGVMNPEPVQGTPEVLHEGQGGMMDVAVDPDYDENGWIYLAYSHALEPDANDPRPPAMTRIVRGKIQDGHWVEQQVIYEAPHETYLTTRHHYGCRIVFDRAGYLYFAIGDRGIMEHAQDLSLPNGKVHRIHRDGSIPVDNPFVNQDGALPTIYSYGNRNPQGLSIHPVTDELWESEHGPMGGDELNLIRAGRNYGWPVISYGRNYDGRIITELTEMEGMEQPNYYWRPSTAVCPIDFYRGDQFPRWRNHLLVGALRFEEVALVRIVEDRIIHEEVILKGMGRVRDVASGPDGAIYVVLNSPDKVLRLSHARDRQY